MENNHKEMHYKRQHCCCLAFYLSHSCLSAKLLNYICFHVQYYTGLLVQNRNNPVWLAGDGQYDSPGFSAKYLVYSLMYLDTGLVVDFELVQEEMVKGKLERAACENIMEKFVNKENCDVKLFLSDRHKGIRYLLKTRFPNIEHEFDVTYQALKKIILDKSFLKDIEHIKHYVYTGCLESYHNLRL
ncbi:hypothetical protein PR048_002777 [Dryococelus australis]|uniref:Uncharacterized protein n=1 Tax=Dryococelus australis TaxID=614101 RepID=A0ABQ9IL85_9NEOP|nr:hypothetical protein PR048_002777 [Dryococelus australis]